MSKVILQKEATGVGPMPREFVEVPLDREPKSIPCWRIVEVEMDAGDASRAGETELVIEVARATDAMGRPRWMAPTFEKGRQHESANPMRLLRHAELQSLVDTIAEKDRALEAAEATINALEAHVKDLEK